MEDARLCPHCGEDLSPLARKCKHCGEHLPGHERDSVEAGPGMLLSLTLGCVLVALLCVVCGVAAAIAAPSLIRVKKESNESAAIDALRAIAASQVQFRARDMEGDGVADYAALGELGAARLVDPDLASGLRQGYVFEVSPSDAEPEKRWMAVAAPMAPGRTGDRYFATNHTGAVYYRESRPFTIDLYRAEMPPDALPLGKTNREVE